MTPFVSVAVGSMVDQSSLGKNSRTIYSLSTPHHKAFVKEAPTVGSSVQLGNRPLFLRVSLTILRHPLKRIERRSSGCPRFAHPYAVSKHRVERAVFDAFPQPAQVGDLGFFFFGQGLWLGNLEGLRGMSVGGSWRRDWEDSVHGV